MDEERFSEIAKMVFGGSAILLLSVMFLTAATYLVFGVMIPLITSQPLRGFF